MWALTNRTPYGVGRNWIRDKQGAHRWVVAVRATFVMQENGALVRATEQPPPSLAPEYYGEPGASGLRRDSDLLALKPGTDVVLDANAHTPYDRPTDAVTVAISVGGLRKTLVVHGERRLRQRVGGGIGLTNAEPFLSRPIRYEMAYGGWDRTDPDPGKHRLYARNPIGRGFAARAEHLHDQPAPSVQYPDGDVAALGPAGFGPIDASWSPRRELAGTYDDAWAKTKRPLLPDDYDERFAMCAPADQQIVPHLLGGERVELVNLTPRGSFVFCLPRHHFTFTTRFGSRSEEHRARLTGVTIEPEIATISLVWQTSLCVRLMDGDYLDATVISEKDYVR